MCPFHFSFIFWIWIKKNIRHYHVMRLAQSLTIHLSNLETSTWIFRNYQLESHIAYFYVSVEILHSYSLFLLGFHCCKKIPWQHLKRKTCNWSWLTISDLGIYMRPQSSTSIMDTSFQGYTSSNKSVPPNNVTSHGSSIFKTPHFSYITYAVGIYLSNKYN